MNQDQLQRAQQVVTRFAQLPTVEAIALAGSQMSGTATESSDIDLYVYSYVDIPVDVRTTLSEEFSDHVEIVDYWGSGNEWDDRETNFHFDLIFWTISWIEEQLDRVLNRHQAALGYTTSLWYTIQHSYMLFDRQGWFSRLQQTAKQPYPQALVKAIVDYNTPVLRGLSSSYLRQLEKASAREDLVSLNHRTAALLSSYFDILFAINRIPHPGEKRLIAFAERHCTKLPIHMREDVEALLGATVNLEQPISESVNTLLNHLDELLLGEGLLQ